MPDTFMGWVRLPGRRWKAVVTASSETEAWDRLQLHVDRLRAKMADLYVGQAGADPGRPRSATGQEHTR